MMPLLISSPLARFLGAEITALERVGEQAVDAVAVRRQGVALMPPCAATEWARRGLSWKLSTVTR